MKHSKLVKKYMAINEEFLSVDDMIGIIYSKKGSPKDLSDLITNFLNPEEKDVKWSAKKITKRLIKAGMTSDEVGEVRTIFNNAQFKVIKQVFSTYNLSTKNDILINKKNFGIYTLWADIDDELYNDIRDKIIEKTEKLVRIKLTTYLKNRK